MDRHYYELKALAVALAIAAAGFGGGLECSRLMRAHNPNYEAAFVAQDAIRDAGLKLRDFVGRFVSTTFSDL